MSYQFLRAVVWLCLSASLLFSHNSLTAQTSSNVTWRAGLGYESISQEFFLDSIIGGDTLATFSQLKTTYLDDLRVLLGIRWQSDSKQRLQAQATYEQSPDNFRFRSNGGIRPQLGQSTFSFLWEFQRRARSGEDTEPGEDFSSGALETRFDAPISGALAGRVGLKGDFLAFDTSSAFIFNHRKLTLSAGVANRHSLDKLIDAQLFGQVRNVPDSTQLDYWSIGLSAGLLTFRSDIDFDLLGRIERRNYARLGGGDDFTLVELNGSLQSAFIGELEGRTELDIEGLHFSEHDLLNASLLRASLLFLALHQFESLSFGAGPRFEVLETKRQEGLLSEDYVEIGGRVQVDYFSLSSVLLSMESTTGYRNLAGEGEFQADFAFERVNLLLDIKFLKRMVFSTLLSAEWEWSTETSLDNRIYLLSTGLYVTF